MAANTDRICMFQRFGAVGSAEHTNQSNVPANEKRKAESGVAVGMFGAIDADATCVVQRSPLGKCGSVSECRLGISKTVVLHLDGQLFAE